MPRIHQTISPLDLFLQDCADTGEDPVTVLCLLLHQPADVDISQKVVDTAMDLLDWDDDTSTLAHEVARIIIRINRRQLLSRVRDAMWADA